jgi:GntR family negative regulator for fad regulon and positive regulator of fabA
VVHAERALLGAILGGDYAPGAALPGERELAARIGVTRPTLREALQRLARDGWITIRQGKPTLVNDFWRDGGMNILTAMAAHGDGLPPGFVAQLLEVRLALAPAYGRAAVARAPEAVAAALAAHAGLEESPEAYAAFDWRLHRALALASGNPIYPLILNGFAGFYEQMAARYFAAPGARARSRAFYRALLAAARASDADAAEALCREASHASAELWARAEATSRER